MLLSLCFLVILELSLPRFLFTIIILKEITKILLKNSPFVFYRIYIYFFFHSTVHLKCSLGRVRSRYESMCERETQICREISLDRQRHFQMHHYLSSKGQNNERQLNNSETSSFPASLYRKKDHSLFDPILNSMRLLYREN